MPHEGYADPITNDGPGFHSNMPVSELTECISRAIEASDVSSTPPVVETADGAMITKNELTLDRTPATHRGSRKVGLARRTNARSQNDRPPKGSKSGKTFSDPPNLMATPPRGPVTMKGNRRPQDMPWVGKEGQGP